MGLEQFWNQIAAIQSSVIGEMVCQSSKYSNLEELLTDMSYVTIYRIMELIDGCGEVGTKYQLENTVNHTVINTKGNLHDMCEERLKHTDK